MVKSKLAYIMLDKNVKSVAELARLTNISRETLTKLYNNKKLETVSLGMLFQICHFFNCNIHVFFDYSPEPFENNKGE